MPSRSKSAWPADLPHSLAVPRTPLHYNVEVSARRYPDKPMAIFYDTPLSYAQAWRETEALAGYLQQRCGVRRGDRVLLLMQNSPQFIIAYYAILRADAMVVPVNPMNLTGELRHYIDNAGTAVAIVGQELYPQLQPLLGAATLAHAVVATYSDYLRSESAFRIPEACLAARVACSEPGAIAWQAALDERLAPAPSQAGPDDLCVMPFTSGTTGLPKGCIHTHATVMFTAVAGAVWFRSIPDTVVLATLPFFHVTGMQGSMNSPIYMGSTIILMQRWDRDTAAQLIRQHRVNSWTNISTMAIDFLANPALEDYDLSSLTRIGGGGAAMPEAVAQKLHDLTGLDYIEGYGLTETIAPTHINPYDRPKKQCLGIPIFDTDARVVEPGTTREVARGEVGEILSRGPQIFKGYWRNPEATAAAFVELDGQTYFRTGDLGRVDEQGYFFIVDRLKRMINAAGYKVWPAEVETILYRHPDVQEACVIGTPDPTRGETVKALVVVKAGRAGAVSAEEIIGWARANMAAYKIPRVIQFVDHLPKSATGKVLWRTLQEQEFNRTVTT